MRLLIASLWLVYGCLLVAALLAQARGLAAIGPGTWPVVATWAAICALCPLFWRLAGGAERDLRRAGRRARKVARHALEPGAGHALAPATAAMLRQWSLKAARPSRAHALREDLLGWGGRLGLAAGVLLLFLRYGLGVQVGEWFNGLAWLGVALGIPLTIDYARMRPAMRARRSVGDVHLVFTRVSESPLRLVGEARFDPPLDARQREHPWGVRLITDMRTGRYGRDGPPPREAVRDTPLQLDAAGEIGSFALEMRVPAPASAAEAAALIVKLCLVNDEDPHFTICWGCPEELLYPVALPT